MEKNNITKSRDHYIAIGSLIVAVVAIISNVFVNWLSNSYQLNVKKYELTYMEKRKGYTELINIFNSINDEFLIVMLNVNPDIDKESLSKMDKLDSVLNTKGLKLSNHKEFTINYKKVDSLCFDIFSKLNDFKNASLNIEPFLDKSNRLLLRNNTIVLRDKLANLVSIFLDRNMILKYNYAFKSLINKYNKSKYDFLEMFIEKDTINYPKYANSYFKEYLTYELEDYFVLTLFEKLFEN